MGTTISVTSTQLGRDPRDPPNSHLGECVFCLVCSKPSGGIDVKDVYGYRKLVTLLADHIKSTPLAEYDRTFHFNGFYGYLAGQEIWTIEAEAIRLAGPFTGVEVKVSYPRVPPLTGPGES